MVKKDVMLREDAAKYICRMVWESGIPGLGGNRFNQFVITQEQLVNKMSVGSELLNFEWEQAWGVNVNLYVKFKSDKRGESPKVECEVSWSSTGRTLSLARAAVVLYSRVIDLGCYIEAHFSDIKVEPLEDYWHRQAELGKKKDKAAYDEWYQKTGRKLTKLFDRESIEKSEAPVRGRQLSSQCGDVTASGEPCSKRSKLFEATPSGFVGLCAIHAKKHYNG